MYKRFQYQILLHTIIVMWGFTGILGKLIHLSPLYIVWYRMLIATISLGIAMYFLKRSFRIPNLKSLLQFLGVGIIVSLHWVTFYMAIDLSTASLGILCLSTTTIHVAWLEPLIMKRPFSWIEFFLGGIVIFGIYFVSGDFDSNQYLALAYGLLSALFAAIFAVSNAYLAKDHPPSKISFYEFIAGASFLTLTLLNNGDLNRDIFVMTSSDFWWLIFLGTLCTSFAFLTVIEIVKYLGAFTVSLSINLEPIYTIVLAIFILNENELLGKEFYIGALLIVLVVLTNAIIKYYQKKLSLKS